MRPSHDRRGRFRHAVWLALPVLAAGCGDDEAPRIVSPPPTGDIVVVASVSGEDPDLNGYTVRLDDSRSDRIGGVRGPETVTFAVVAPGEHELELTRATDNCEVTGENPRTVTVSEGRTASTTFELTCTRVQKVAFLGDRHLDDLDLSVMHADGQDHFEITGIVGSTSEERSFAWSPDGTEIAYQLTDEGIQLVDETGENESPLTGPRSYRPDWSPDASRIAYQSDRTGDHDVWIVSADGTGETNLTADPDAEDLRPDWAPDASRIVFEKGDEIWTMAPDGSDVSAVAGADFDAAGSPSWSPDGSRIAFVGTRSGEPVGIWSVVPDGSDLRRLTSDAVLADAVVPRWSPDGTRIAFQGRSGPLAAPEIWTVEADGSNLTNLADVSGAEAPRWSPDGSRIVFARNDRQIWVVDADGSDPQAIGSSILIASDPAWRPPR